MNADVSNASLRTIHIIITLSQSFIEHCMILEPWFHVGYFFLGAYIGQKWVNLERELVLDINEIRADKGLPPMVGSNAWVKYKKPETDGL